MKILILKHAPDKTPDDTEALGKYECVSCQSVLLVAKGDVKHLVDRESMNPEHECMCYTPGFKCPSCRAYNYMRSAKKIESD